MSTTGTFLKPIFIAGTSYPVGAATIDDALVSQIPRDTFVPDVEPVTGGEDDVKARLAAGFLDTGIADGKVPVWNATQKKYIPGTGPITAGPITAASITDAGTAGRAVLQAETQAQGRTALGVGLAPTPVQRTALSGTQVVLTEASTRAQVFTLTSNTTVKLPATGANTWAFTIFHGGGAFTLSINKADDTLLTALTAGDASTVVWDGTALSTSTALSTWTGSANLATVGTITAGTWHGSAIADTYISSASAWNAKVSFPGFGTTAGTAAEGNDARLSDARTPLAHTQAWSTITSTPTTLAGYGVTDAQGLDSDLTALAGLSTTGLVARTGAGTAATRTITGTTNQVIVSNGDGVSGNPTLALPQSIATDSTPQFARIGIGGAADDTYLLNLNGALVHGTSTGVGIGTTSPAAQLHLRSGSDNIAEAIRLDNPTDTDDNGSKIVWRNADISNDAAFFAARRIGDSNGFALTFGTAADWSTAAATEKMRIAGNGNVGINNTDPLRKLDVVGDDGGHGIRVTGTTGTTGAFTAEGTSVTIQADSAAATCVLIDAGTLNASGYAVINGGSSGYVQLGTGGTPQVQVFASGAVKLNSYGAGTLQTDGSGNVTASSDASLKTVTGSFTRGLADVLKLTPRTYHWNEKSGMNTEDENVGFIAQEVLDAVPEAVGQYRTTEMEIDGKKTKKREKSEFLTLSDRPLIAALVNAVKELKAENDALLARVSALENGKAAK